MAVRARREEGRYCMEDDQGRKARHLGGRRRRDGEEEGEEEGGLGY